MKSLYYINASSSLKTMYKKPKILNEATIETISSIDNHQSFQITAYK